MRMHPVKHIAGAGIAVFWLAMMAWVVRNHGDAAKPVELGGEPFSSEILGGAWQDIEEWLEARSHGKPIGFARMALRREKKGGGYRLSSRADLRLGPTADFQLNFLAAARLGGDLELDSFLARAQSAAFTIEASGFVLDKKLYLKFDGGEGRVRRAYWPLEEPVSMMEALRPLAARKIDLVEGETRRVRVFDPIWGGRAGEATVTVRGKETISVGGKDVRATRVETSLAGNTAVAWVAPDHTVLRYELLNGLVFEQIDPAQGRKMRPDFGSDPELPAFNVQEYAHDLKMVDLSQGSPFGALIGIFMEMAAGRK